MRVCPTLHITACGSGNFLVIAYKELRRLEHSILERLQELEGTVGSQAMESFINIENFFGIEIDDFATEVAILSLWIAKHQMNVEFEEKFGIAIPLIPLKETGQIRAGNATRISWDTVCPNNGTDEIYLIGNPPYVGSSMQTKEQKEDFEFVFGDRKHSKNLDYISLWFIKGSEYIKDTIAEAAFVSTNSVTQGDHVGLMFPFVFELGIEIGFAYTSFKWENNAKYNAGVTVVVIGLRRKSSKPKYLFKDGLKNQASNVNPYLTDAPDVIIERRSRPLNVELPAMVRGSQPTDGGNLALFPEELTLFEFSSQVVKDSIKKYVGAAEFIRGIERYCLWIDDQNVEEISKDTEVSRRLEKVAAFRKESSAASTVEYAIYPHRFRQRAYRPTNSIIVPSVSSERRDYVPIGFLSPDTVISNLAFAIYDAEPWLFALLTSRIHTAWLRAVGGKMETRYRYSNTIVYNTFPVPDLTFADKEALTEAALRILDVREYHCGSTLAELYDPEKMPDNLRDAHKQVDDLVDKLYSATPFEDDDARLSTLFAMYEEAIKAEELAAANKPKRARKK